MQTVKMESDSNVAIKRENGMNIKSEMEIDSIDYNLVPTLGIQSQMKSKKKSKLCIRNRLYHKEWVHSIRNYLLVKFEYICLFLNIFVH